MLHLIAAPHNPYIAKSSSSVYRLGLLNAKIADKEWRLEGWRNKLHRLVHDDIPKERKQLEYEEWVSHFSGDEWDEHFTQRCREDLARSIANVPKYQDIVRQYAEMIPKLQEERQALIVHLTATRGA